MTINPSVRRGITPRAVLVVLAFVWGPFVRADDPSPVPSDPIFRAVRTDSSVISGRIRQLGPKKQLLITDGTTETVIPFDQLVVLTREGDAAPAGLPDSSTVLFPEGDRLRAQIGNSSETDLTVQPTLTGDASVSVPLDSLLAILLSPSQDPVVQEALLTKLCEEPRKSDILLLNNDDRQSGGFLSLKSDKVAFQRDNGPPETDRVRVTAVEFTPTAVKYPAPAEGPWLELTFQDGSRLGAKSVQIDQGQVVFETRFGPTLKVPIKMLSAAHVRGGAVDYLADRKEALAEYVGYLGDHRKSYGKNKTADGHAMRLAGRPYDRGLGTQSRTLLAYRLNPSDKRFQATVGLDERAGTLGSVVFRVLVDGKERAATPPMTCRDAPRTLDIDLTGARILILATEFGERGDVQDLADWVEARIIRSNEP